VRAQPQGPPPGVLGPGPRAAASSGVGACSPSFPPQARVAWQLKQPEIDGGGGLSFRSAGEDRHGAQGQVPLVIGAVDSGAHERRVGLLGGGREPGGEKTAGQFRDKARGRVHEFGPGPRRVTSDEEGNRRTDGPTNVPSLFNFIGRDI
jgi:hypothetical protein